jgi:3-oxoacyl-(acyl-carrier-protein) synthase
MSAVIMCSESYAAAHQLQVQAAIESWGISCDATHITAPSRSGSGLIRVIEQATRNRTIPVGAINAHGTGTVYNDAMEMTAFQACWDHQPPFHSVKGAIGHCLGAAGVIEAAIALRSLERGVIPPSVGYRGGEAPAGTISGSSPLALSFSTILACNSGFGGINAGIIFSKP